MSGQNDRSSGSRTLPLAELNPLLNPLLAENMGRWAEVYFTSPPERREQAVLELLRELEAKRSEQDQSEEPTRASDSALAQTPIKTVMQIRCDGCGGENPVSNKYCGTCGAGLGEARAYSIFGDPDSRTAFGGQHYPPYSSGDEHSTEEDQIQISAHERRAERYETQYAEENRNESYPYPREFRRPSNGNNMSLLHLNADPESDEGVDWTDEPEPSAPYRYYIGAVLAIIILVLGYMAWRGTQAGQNSHEVSAPPPAAASDTAAAPAPTPAPAKTAAQPPVQAPAADASAHATQPEDASKNPPETRSSRDQVAENAPVAAAASPTRSAHTTPAAQPPSPAATQLTAGNGGEELAVAERFLNGAPGQRRDTTEAAKWLWKSVAKHNGQATVLLSDLYLKGEGVSKNCDQARVLLYSAARKGIAGAGERLRNLPAFGCE